MHQHRSRLRRLLAGPPLAVLLAAMLLSHAPVAVGPTVPAWTPPPRPATPAPERAEVAPTLLAAPARPARGGWKDPLDPTATTEDDPLVLADPLSWGWGGSFIGSSGAAGPRIARPRGAAWHGFGGAGGWGGGGGGGFAGGAGAGGPGGQPGPSPRIEIADTQPAEPAWPEFSLPGEGGTTPETGIAERDLLDPDPAAPSGSARTTPVPEPASLALLGLGLLGLGFAGRHRRQQRPG